jgi:FixJ family two-component response regulator
VCSTACVAAAALDDHGYVLMISTSVHVLDDDAFVRRGLERQLRVHGWNVKTYASVAEFEQSDAAAEPGCLLLDLRIPDGSGLDLLARLEQSRTPLSVVLVSGYGDVPSTVRAMRLGAVDFLTKPISEDRLLEAVAQATAKSAAAWEERKEMDAVRSRFARLTPREREVCTLVASGLLNKQIASQLDRSEKTVKVHRGRVMDKLEVASVAELVRLLDRLNGPHS